MTSVQNHLLPTADQLRDRVRTALQAVGAHVTLGEPGARGLQSGSHAVAPLIGGGQEMILHRGHDAAFS